MPKRPMYTGIVVYRDSLQNHCFGVTHRTGLIHKFKGQA